MRQLGISRIEEPQVRDNFKAIETELANSPIFNAEWRLYDRTYDAAGTFSISHKLGFKPLDLLITYSTATFSLDFSTADENNITLTVTAPGRMRFLLGRMK